MSSSTVLMKFGGTSVGSAEAIASVVGIVRDAQAQGQRVVVVVSAMSGVTDMLLRSARAAAAGDRWEVQSLARQIRERHDEVVHTLIPVLVGRQAVLGALAHLLEDHARVCEAVCVLGELSPRLLDLVVSFGERLSSRLVAAVLQAHGLAARQFDTTGLLITNDSFQSAVPDEAVTQARVQAALWPVLHDGGVPVLTGYIGATLDGLITTLGRGGSDYSAALLAAALPADELIIWTDVDGVMTTDPRIDRRARVLADISYTEVGELAFYGAKVLHPKTVQPIVALEMPMRVRNTFNPAHPGTLIRAQAMPTATVIKAVTCVRNVSLLMVGGRGMLGVPGIAGRTFLATAGAGASILMISQSSSEQSFCFTVPEDRAASVKQAVEEALASEIARRDVDAVTVLEDVVILTAVGAGMRGTPGVAGRVFSQMGAHGINVLSIAQGSSECSISFVVAEADMRRAVVALHDLALVHVGEAVGG